MIWVPSQRKSRLEIYKSNTDMATYFELVRAATHFFIQVKSHFPLQNTQKHNIKYTYQDRFMM